MSIERSIPRQEVPRGPLGGDYWEAEPTARLSGFADPHAHLMADLAFGGRAFWGEPYDPEHSGQEATEHALASCEPVHGGLRDVNAEFGHPAGGGWPEFVVWPRFNTLVHQQAYIDWIFRAYQGGLRLITCLAVNNELLAIKSEPELPTDDKSTIERQIVAMKKMAAVVEAEGRKGGLRELLGRALIWRVDIRWWIVALFFMIVPSVASLYLYHLLGGPAMDWSGLQPLYTVIPKMLFLTIAAGIGEEFGWRGFLLPRLQTRYNALVSSLIIGGMWAIWHIPLFFLEGTFQHDLGSQAGLLPAILAYSVFVIVSSIWFTWVFNNTGGSVLLAAVLHGASNAWGGYIDVYRGYFGGILTFGAVSALVSIIIVLIAGATDLSRTNQRNVLELEGEQPDITQLPKEGVAQSSRSQ